MILGIGLDLVSIARLAALVERRSDASLRRLFAAGEIAYCRSRARPEESFAARFAAKEAFFKALGTGWGPAGAWDEVEVVVDEAGAPSLRLGGRAAASAAARGVRRLHLSLTHTQETAGAVVLLEG